MKYAILAVLIAGVLLFVACSANVQHDVNRASKQFSDDLDQLDVSATNLYKGKEIDIDDYAAIENFTSEALDDHKNLTAQLRTLPEPKDAKTKSANLTQALVWTQQFVDKIHGYNLHLKSAKAQALEKTFFASFDTLMNTVILSLQKQAKLNRLDTVMRADAGGEVPAAILIIAEIYNALAALVIKYKSDGTLTDQQLQDAADAEDDETKKRILQHLQEIGK